MIEMSPLDKTLANMQANADMYKQIALKASDDEFGKKLAMAQSEAWQAALDMIEEALSQNT